MRLHHLEITAFGPFADTTSIDFDALSEAGLFLLTGPTGAGKTSILDAVCFALYGDVPGDRATAKRLRSDHASPEVMTRVVLEATLSGRRFRLDRSPAWQRPKKRGTGLTTEQARVVISEHLASESGAPQWRPLSTRLDETGHLVTRLLGLNLPQFCQVALLPQGRFQDFLRSTSQERHALLQQVFQTGRFDQVERWLRDRRVSLRRVSESHCASVGDLVSRVSEVSGAPAPQEWEGSAEDLVPWVSDLTESTQLRCAAARLGVHEAQEHERDSSAAAAAGAELVRLQQTHAGAQRALQSLEDSSSAHHADVARLRSSRAAEAVRPLLELAKGTSRSEQEARDHVAERRAELTQALGPRSPEEDVLDDEAWVASQQRVAAQLMSEITRVRPLQTQVERGEKELTTEASRRDACRDEAAMLTTRLTQVDTELSLLRSQCRDTEPAAHRVAALTQEVEDWSLRLEAAHLALELAASRQAALDELRKSMELRLTSRERLVEIREQRLNGMAAEIASRLAVGSNCPVCGSHEHPSLAQAAPGAADDASESQARKNVDDLEAVVEAHAQHVRGLEAQLAATEAKAQRPCAELMTQLDRATSNLASAQHDALMLEQATRQVTRLEEERTHLTEERDALATTIAQSEVALALLTARLETLRHDIDMLLDEHGHDSLETLARHTQEVETAASRHLRAISDLRHAHEGAHDAAQRAHRTACEAGFESAGEADDAWLPEASAQSLEQEVQRYEREIAAARETLADPVVIAAAHTPHPDLERLTHDTDAARSAASLAVRTRDTLVERAERLEGLARQLHEALDRWTPIRQDLAVVTDLAAFVEGKHPDNRLQMRLSAYVLAHRLSQVVQAANLRLRTMSDQRYALVHTGQRGAGETRGGLSLLVRDEWSGESRDPATLSGGETFVVSLALALGLADVITDEAGGADLHTLFVDEGFGALDADTLEDVMDTLDTLRDGGRVVGVVSHVPELQTRIPTQLRVHKSRHGSRARVSLG